MNDCVNRILELLDEKGVKNCDFCTELGLPSSAVSEWKSGKVQSYRKYIGEMADFFDVSADYILGRSAFQHPADWNDLIQQYQLCSDDKQKLVNRLLGLTHSEENGGVCSVPVNEEEDMTAILEILSMFDKLNLVGKSRVIATVADEYEKIKKGLNGF